MSEIDWSKAPEGTSHYLKEVGSPLREYWIKQSPDSIYFCRLGFEKDGFRQWTCDYVRFLPLIIQRPTTPQWNGEGLPPAGAVCEAYDDESRGWISGYIAHVGVSDGVRMAVFQADNAIYHGEAGMFRPIRTPEQIAAEERSKECDRMFGIILDRIPEYRRHNRSDIVEALYDAGYRKQEGK